MHQLTLVVVGAFLVGDIEKLSKSQCLLLILNKNNN